MTFTTTLGMRDKTILTAGPSITQKEIDYVLDAVTNGWNANWAGYITAFEKAFAEYIGVRYAMTTSSGTGALHLGLLALGVGPGDEVIVPDNTWIATAAAVTYCGATPVFADVLPDIWCLDPESVRKAITKRTKAIMPVHLYGNPTDMDEIWRIADEYGLKIVEDAAPSVGSIYHGRKTGSLGDVAAFSFQGAKILATGEGGMLVTDDETLFERARFLGDHGRDPNRPFWINEIGHKYKMSNLQAALGLAQLERIEELVAKKRLIHSWYKARLADIPGLAMNMERPNTRSMFWMTSLVLNRRFAVTRDGLIAGLKEVKIDSRPFFPLISSFGLFEDSGPPTPVSAHLAENGINLPSGHNLTEEEVDWVAQNVRSILLCARPREIGECPRSSGRVSARHRGVT